MSQYGMAGSRKMAFSDKLAIFAAVALCAVLMINFITPYINTGITKAGSRLAAVLPEKIDFGVARAEAGPRVLKVGVSIYAGWMPWYYMMDFGIMSKWAQKYGIQVEIVPFGDYVGSIEAFVAGKVDACVMTNMECLDMPANSGIDCTVLIVGDYSNGNDAVITRNNLQIKDLKGRTIYLVENTVSHYMLARALEMNVLRENDVRIVNTSDSDIGPVFLSNNDQDACVTWNPIVMNIMQSPGMTDAFNSSQIPGEILDLLVVNTAALKKNPGFGEALAGAWFETMNIMTSRSQSGREALQQMANRANCTVGEFQNQLRTTMMYYKPQDAVAYTAGAEIKQKMDLVRKFCGSHGLIGGEAGGNENAIGIEFPDGTVLGNKAKVRMRFTTKYMQMVADGSL